MIQSTKAIVDTFISGLFDLWLWFTVGLIAIIAFFGRRLVKRWDEVTNSHMPDHLIEKKMAGIRKEMNDCQERISHEQQQLIEGMTQLHNRLDSLYNLLLSKSNEQSHTRHYPRDTK